MRTMQFLLNYLREVLKTWGGVIFLVGDMLWVLELARNQYPNVERFITRYSPQLSNLSWTPELFLGFVVVCLLLANFQIFVRQQKQIAELEIQEACVVISARYHTFSLVHQPLSQLIQKYQRRVVVDGLDDNRIPVYGTLSAQLEVENLGRERGQLRLELEQAKVKLPSVFTRDFFAQNASQFVPARSSRPAHINLYFCVQECDKPESFARSLGKLSRQEYDVRIPYHTHHVGGESKGHYLRLRGNFEVFSREIITHWKNSGFNDLVAIYDDSRKSGQFSRFF